MSVGVTSIVLCCMYTLLACMPFLNALETACVAYVFISRRCNIVQCPAPAVVAGAW